MRQLLQKVGDVNGMVSANSLDFLVGEGHDCPSGSTSLFIASTGNPPSLVSVSLLLAAGADVNLPCDCFFVTHSEVKIPGQTTCLTRAAQQGFLIVVNLLLEQGANLSLMTQRPLTTAVAFGHLEIVNALLNARAELNATDDFARYRFKCTALTIAAQSSSAPIVHVLLLA